MNKIKCFVPFSGAAQAEKTVKGLQETGIVNNILSARPTGRYRKPTRMQYPAHAIHPVQHCHEGYCRT